MMKDIPGYDGKYKINESGVVINKNGHVMRYALSNTNRLRYALEDVGYPDKPGTKRRNLSVHRLVAETFLPNPDNLPVVMHLDNDPLNNHVSNLQWGTQSDNILQAFREGRKYSPYKGLHYNYPYDIYNDDDPNNIDSIRVIGRSEVANLIQYEEISLKNMVGNDRKISLGPYAGYKIRRINVKLKPGETVRPMVDFNYNDKQFKGYYN